MVTEILIQIWQTYPALLDLALYFFVFAAATRASLAKTFPGSNGKALAIAVGLALAASLTLTQHTLGFTLEKLGPIAAILLGGIIAITAYRFMHQAQVPTHLALALTGLVAATVLHTIMPDFTSSIIENNALLVISALAALLLWVWARSDKHADTIMQRRPGMILARHHDLPDRGLLGKATRLVKKGMQRATADDEHREAKIKSETEKALRILEKEGVTPGNKEALLALTREALIRAKNIRNETQRILKLDDAIGRFDLEWLRRAHKINLHQLSPSQRRIMRRSVQDERERIKAEQSLGALERQVEEQCLRLQQFLDRAQESIEDMNPSGASGWLVQAQRVDQDLQELESQVNKWEKRLLGLIRRERKELTTPDTSRQVSEATV